MIGSRITGKWSKKIVMAVITLRHNTQTWEEVAEWINLVWLFVCLWTEVMCCWQTRRLEPMVLDLAATTSSRCSNSYPKSQLPLSRNWVPFHSAQLWSTQQTTLFLEMSALVCVITTRKKTTNQPNALDSSSTVGCCNAYV